MGRKKRTRVDILPIDKNWLETECRRNGYTIKGLLNKIINGEKRKRRKIWMPRAYDPIV